MGGEREPAGAARPRVFVALVLPPELADALAGAALEALGGAGRATREHRIPRPDGLHATLFFLGNVLRERLAPLGEALASGLRGAPAPALVLRQAGAFPRWGKERVLWIGAEEADGRGRLLGLRERVLDAVEAAGFATEEERARPFRAHVTLARPREGCGATEAFRELDLALPWTPGEAALVESRREGPGPPVYAVLERFPLAPTD